VSDQAEFRRHLAELRKAAGGLGRDFRTEFSEVDSKIERLGSATARDAAELGREIQDDLTGLADNVSTELRRVPHGLAEAGTAIGSGTVRAAGAAKDAVLTAGHKAKEGTKNAFAVAAGVRRTPIKAWSPPGSDSSEASKDESSDEH
jgi:hypothetical protein